MIHDITTKAKREKEQASDCKKDIDSKLIQCLSQVLSSKSTMSSTNTSNLGKESDIIKTSKYKLAMEKLLLYQQKAQVK